MLFSERTDNNFEVLGLKIETNIKLSQEILQKLDQIYKKEKF